jgi:predicted 3-demethylubiquinone-9 3-methyltransferase (glyoxalase superfamily)
MDEIMQKATPEQAQKVTKAFLAMKKFDIAKLEEAFNS